MVKSICDSDYHQSGETLIRETIAGNRQAVDRLIASGVDVNFANINAFTPLMAAAQWKELDIVEVLLAHGASTSTPDNSNGRTPLMYACLSGCSQCVALLVQAGSPVNVRDDTGLTPLMLAAVTGELAMVKHLVNAGAKLDAQDEQGFRPVDWAHKWGRKTVVSYLLSRMAELGIAIGEVQGPDKSFHLPSPELERPKMRSKVRSSRRKDHVDAD